MIWEEFEKLEEAVFNVWQTIGSDAMEFVESNKEALELCIDADRLLLVGGDMEADKFVKDVVQEYGIDILLDELDRRLTLI